MEKTIFTLKKFIISYVNYRTLHVKQPDVASGVRPETKPLVHPLLDIRTAKSMNQFFYNIVTGKQVLFMIAGLQNYLNVLYLKTKVKVVSHIGLILTFH